MSRPTVLYVEDDDNDAVLMRYAWKKVGVLNPLQVVTDGDIALRYLSGVGLYADRAAHPIPCLALIDLKLPTISGFDVLEWIRTEPAIHTLPVVVLSSSTREVEVHTAHALRVNAYLEKPSTFDGWRHLVAGVNEFWLTRAQMPPAAYAAPRLIGRTLSRPAAESEPRAHREDGLHHSKR